MKAYDERLSLNAVAEGDEGELCLLSAAYATEVDTKLQLEKESMAGMSASDLLLEAHLAIGLIHRQDDPSVVREMTALVGAVCAEYARRHGELLPIREVPE